MATITTAQMDAGSSVLNVGVTGSAVPQLRTYLASAGYASSSTTAALTTTDASKVSSFQSAFGLKVDGKCGSLSWNRMKINHNCKQNPATSQTSTLLKYAPTINSTLVGTLQSKLNSIGYSGSVDNLFGSTTLKFVLHFQATHGLTIDGIVGSNFQSKLTAVTNLSSTYRDIGKPCIGTVPTTAVTGNVDIIARLLYGEANNTSVGMKSVGQVLCNRNVTSPATAARAAGQFTSICEANNTGASPDRTSSKWTNAVTNATSINGSPSSVWHQAIKDEKYLNFNSSGVPSGATKVYPYNPLEGNYFYTK